MSAHRSFDFRFSPIKAMAGFEEGLKGIKKSKRGQKVSDTGTRTLVSCAQSAVSSGERQVC